MSCPACGIFVDVADAFCRGCGVRLARVGGGGIVGGRRQLTVMFCDLVGSTAMAARLDPEDVQTVLGAYQQLAAEIVRNVDGHVAQYLGDGMLIYLGYPAAHEDDPVRAVSAALEIARGVPGLAGPLQALVPDIRPGDLAVRIGIHTGPVVVGAVGSDIRREQLASGSTVNLAARLAAAAAPGGILASAATAQRAEGMFVFEPVGPQALKGWPAPVPAFRPTAPRGIRSRIAAWSDGSGRVMVGRDGLLAALVSGWDAVRAGEARAEDARVVVLRGEAGIGKTRLVQALRQQLAGQPHAWLSCHGSALQQASALYPVIEAMRASLELDGGEPDDEVRARLAAKLAAIGLDAPEMIERLAGVLGVGEARIGRTLEERARTLEAMVRWLLRLARDRPLVVAIEDLHWFDPSSLELVTLLIDMSGAAPIQVVGTIRPDAAMPWPAERVRVIEVPALGVGEITAIIDEIVGGTQVPREAIAQIAGRCDGVPLYAEELAQSLVEQARHGIAGTAVPASLQDSIMARLDLLGANKRLAQVGALLGRSFSHELVAAVTGLDEAFLGPGLAEIVSRGILHRDGIPPRATYTFRHALLQDAAADSVLRRQFRHDHRRIGTMLVERFAALAEDNPMRVAQHFAQAGAAAEAMQWYRRAGAQAQERAAYREAEIAYRRAIAMAETQMAAGAGDEGLRELYGALARVLQLTHGYAAAEAVEATLRAVRRDGGGDAAATGDERRLWQATLTRAEYGAARVHADAIMARWEADREDGDLLMFALGAQIQVGFFTGDLASVERWYGRMAGLIPTIGMRQPPGNSVSAIGVAAMAAWWQGEAATARARIAAAADFAEATGDPYDRAMALHYRSQLHLCEADAAAARRVGGQLLALAQEQGFAYLAALALGPISWTTEAGGVVLADVVTVRASIAGQIEAGARIAMTTQLNRLAEIEMLAGETVAALATIERALVFNPEERLYRPASLLIRGRFRAAEGDADGARADFGEALALARAMGAWGIALPVAIALARLWHDGGDGEAAWAVLAPVADRCGEGCNPADHAEAAGLLELLRPVAAP